MYMNGLPVKVYLLAYKSAPEWRYNYLIPLTQQRTQSIPEMAGRSDHSPSPPPPRVAADVNFQYPFHLPLKCT